MDQSYLVELSERSDDSQARARITAANKTAALLTFLTRYAPADEVFVAYAHRTSINLSFAEHFWIQTDHEADLYDEGLLQLSDTELVARVHRFFGARQDFADVYLTHYFNDDDGAPPQNFPPEMLAYIWLYSGYEEVTASLVSL